MEPQHVFDSPSTFRLLFEASPVAIAISSLSDGKFIEVNTAFLALHGYRREEVIGHTSNELHLWNRPEQRVAAVAQLQAEGKTLNFAHEYRSKSGKVGRALVSARIVQLNGVDCMLGFITEINELDETQRALMERVSEQQAVFEHLSNGVAHCRMILDDGRPCDFVYLRVNQAFERQTGLKDVVGRKVSEVIPGITEQDPGLIETYGRVAMTGNPETFEVHVDALDQWFSITAICPRPGEFIAIFDVITHQKRVQAELAEKETEFRSMAEAMPQIVWITDAQGRNIYFNQQWVDYTGMTLEESYGDGWNKPFHPDDQQRAWEAWQNAVTNDGGYSLECRLRRFTGRYRWWLIRGVPFHGPDGKIEKWFGTCTDIHELKLAQEKMQSGRAKLEAALASMSDAVFISDTEGNFIDFNDAFATFHKFPGKEECAKTFAAYPEFLDVLTLEGELVPVDQWAVPSALRGESGTDVEYRLHRRDTGETWIGSYNYAPVRGPDGAIIGSVVTARDITQRKQAEQLLRKESAKSLALLRNASDGVHILDRDGRVVDVSDSFCTMLGYSRAEMIGMHVTQWDAQFSEEEASQLLRQQFENPQRTQFETMHRRKDGSTFPVEISGMAVNLEGELLLYNSSRDISQRKASEKVLQEYLHKLTESERQFRGVIEHSPSGIYVTQHDRIVYANQRLCELLDLPLASLLGQNSLDVFLKGEGIRDQVERNRQSLRKTGETRHLEATYTRPDGTDIVIHVFGAVGFWNGEKAIVAMVEDVTIRQRAEARIAAYVKQLENSMHDTLQAIAHMVEMRDPYTAGHERRVGIIAADIAREMGWPEDKCESMVLMGLVHDIGKIAIPAETLSKPTRLTPVEYQIVQAHVEQGYQILKDVNFPLPIADIIRQHHERLDGTGYPLGLKGEQILPEARILAVADVVESMSSHRPYRPALGIDAAMHEIEQHRTTWFDPEVVDAIVRMVRTKGYQLPV